MWKANKGELYVAVQIILFALIALGPRSSSFLPLWLDSITTVTKPLGFIIGFAAVFLIVAGLVNLGSNLSILPHPKDSAELIQSGAYGLVRHPIYSGLILATFGWSFIIGSTFMLIYAIILFVFFEIKSRREEKQLSLFFKDYESYKKKVKKLLPFVY